MKATEVDSSLLTAKKKFQVQYNRVDTSTTPSIE
ncbi:hypothetical protein HVX32_17275 [Escherichia coli]|nr:hypothetical protein HVX32_17275 [Escherichia coli]